MPINSSSEKFTEDLRLRERRLADRIWSMDQTAGVSMQVILDRLRASHDAQFMGSSRFVFIEVENRAKGGTAAKLCKLNRAVGIRLSKRAVGGSEIETEGFGQGHLRRTDVNLETIAFLGGIDNSAGKIRSEE